MTIDATQLRQHVYDVLLANGRPPLARQIGAHFGTSEAEAKAAIASIRIGKALLPHPVTGEIWMAGPFASEPTAYVVRGKATTWFANCAWDMFGVAAIAGQNTTVETWCTDCRERMTIAASPSEAPKGEAVVHLLVPARRWYDDVGFT